MRCDLQIFSGCVCHLEQLLAQYPFQFPIVLVLNNMICVYVNLSVTDHTAWTGIRRLKACTILPYAVHSHVFSGTARKNKISCQTVVSFNAPSFFLYYGQDTQCHVHTDMLDIVSYKIVISVILKCFFLVDFAFQRSHRSSKLIESARTLPTHQYLTTQ